MCGRESQTELACNLKRFLFARAAHAGQDVSQVLAVDVFHRKEHMPIYLADVVHPAHVGMGDLSRVAHFTAKTIKGN